MSLYLHLSRYYRILYSVICYEKKGLELYNKEIETLSLYNLDLGVYWENQAISEDDFFIALARRRLNT